MSSSTDRAINSKTKTKANKAKKHQKGAVTKNKSSTTFVNKTNHSSEADQCQTDYYHVYESYISITSQLENNNEYLHLCVLSGDLNYEVKDNGLKSISEISKKFWGHEETADTVKEIIIPTQTFYSLGLVSFWKVLPPFLQQPNQKRNVPCFEIDKDTYEKINAETGLPFGKVTKKIEPLFKNFIEECNSLFAVKIKANKTIGMNGKLIEKSDKVGLISIVNINFLAIEKHIKKILVAKPHEAKRYHLIGGRCDLAKDTSIFGAMQRESKEETNISLENILDSATINTIKNTIDKLKSDFATAGTDHVLQYQMDSTKYPFSLVLEKLHDRSAYITPLVITLNIRIPYKLMECCALNANEYFRLNPSKEIDKIDIVNLDSDTINQKMDKKYVVTMKKQYNMESKETLLKHGLPLCVIVVYSESVFWQEFDKRIYSDNTCRSTFLEIVNALFNDVSLDKSKSQEKNLQPRIEFTDDAIAAICSITLTKKSWHYIYTSQLFVDALKAQISKIKIPFWINTPQNDEQKADNQFILSNIKHKFIFPSNHTLDTVPVDDKQIWSVFTAGMSFILKDGENQIKILTLKSSSFSDTPKYINIPSYEKLYTPCKQKKGKLQLPSGRRNFFTDDSPIVTAFRECEQELSEFDLTIKDFVGGNFQIKPEEMYKLLEDKYRKDTADRFVIKHDIFTDYSHVMGITLSAVTEKGTWGPFFLLVLALYVVIDINELSPKAKQLLGSSKESVKNEAENASIQFSDINTPIYGNQSLEPFFKELIEKSEKK